jgi:hypothetical protein
MEVVIAAGLKYRTAIVIIAPIAIATAKKITNGMAICRLYLLPELLAIYLIQQVLTAEGASAACSCPAAIVVVA